MIELKIDGLDVDINQSANIAVTHAIADIEEPDNSSAGFSKSVELPLTPRNMRVFGFINELYSKDQFNNNLHAAEYLVDGVCVMSGIAQIDKVSFKFGSSRKLIGGSFHISVLGASFEWITNAKKQLNELQSDETVTYNMSEVRTNSVREDATLIKFFPIDRGAFWKKNIDGDMIPRVVLDLKDFHPFFNVWKTLCLILSGHTVRSSMEEYFKRLYCSGYVPEAEDLSYLKEENDFKCGTSLTGEIVDFQGLYLWSLNLFDRWTSNEEDDYFVATEGILSKPKDLFYTIFKPTGRLPVAFNIRLMYASNVGMNGAFVDTFSFGQPSSVFKFSVLDSKESKDSVSISELKPGNNYLMHIRFDDYKKYKSLIFVYRVRRKDEHSGLWYEEEHEQLVVVIINKAEHHGRFSIPDSYISCDFYLKDSEWERVDMRLQKDIHPTFIPMGVLGESHLFSLNFDKELTTTPYTLQGNSDGYPLSAIFYTSQKGSAIPSFPLKVTIGKCEITPDFKSAIGLGDDVGISTIGGTGTQLDFIAALRQMFNLMFYTNQISKEVYIEPRTKFYAFDQTDIVNWKDKIDYSKEIEIEELGADAGNLIKLGYTDGNEVVQYYNWKNKTELGAYNEPLLNKTTNEAKEIINSTFAPFILRNVGSVGMLIPQDQPDKNQDEISEVNLDITPIMGYFAGLSDRTTGEDREIYPKYPQLVFQDAAKGVNLGFGDIITDSIIPGLHQYYEDNITAYNYGRRITIYLKLNAQDVEAIQFPNRLMRDLRGIFLLNIDGEDVPCLLESIEDYNPAKGASTKCKFIIFPDVKLSSPTPTPPPPIGHAMIVITYDGVAIAQQDTLVGYK